jgi:hypothetical protein
MSGNPVRPFDPSIRALIRALSEARDEQLAAAVALLDALSDRGDADALIEPLRKRLARLRPRRPLTFCRLLFSPLDPVIVPAARWRQILATIPRTALPPLAETVRAAMGPAAQPIEALIKGRSAQETDIVARAGVKLWADAGRVLSTVPKPIGWAHTGLNVSIYPPLARRVGAVLQHLEALDRLVEDTGRSRAIPDPDRVAAILAAAAGTEPDAQPMMTTLLLARLPQASQSLGGRDSAADSLKGAALRLAGNQAIELLLDQLETPGTIETQLGRGTMMQSAELVRRMGLLLQEADATGTRDQHGRLTALRRRAEETCRARFAAALATDVVGKLIVPIEPFDAASIDQLEAAARGLRMFETEARALGGGASYDSLLKQAADTVRGLPASGALGKVQRVRLVELLAGPDAALAMLR